MPSTSVYTSQRSACSAAANATAVVSEAPRPSVVMSKSSVIPWNPATMTTLPAASSRCTRAGSSSTIEARPWAVSVRIPACAPPMLTASIPMSCRAIVSNAHETVSPVDNSRSSSRGWGFDVIDRASAIRSSVVLPMAETTTVTSWPCARADATRLATDRMRSGSATDVPPYFCTRRAIRRTRPVRRRRPRRRRRLARAHGRSRGAAACPRRRPSRSRW